MTLVPALLFCLVMLVAGIAGSTLFARLEAKYVLQED
jgi:hypothetical protein